MAKTLFQKATYTQHHHYISNIIPNSSSNTMAVCSSFSPCLPSQFGNKGRPISRSSAKPKFFVSSKAFTAQANTSITKGTSSFAPNFHVSFSLLLEFVFGLTEITSLIAEKIPVMFGKFCYILPLMFNLSIRWINELIVKYIKSPLCGLRRCQSQ